MAFSGDAPGAHRSGLLCPAVAMACAATTAVFALAPSGAAAQAVAGRVLDETGHPVIAATVTLLGLRDDTLDASVSDGRGAFLLQAARSGRYRLRAERLGFAAATSGPVDLLPDDTLVVELQLSVEPVTLPPLTVLSDRPALMIDSRLARWGYYERRRLYGWEGMGFAHFIDYQEIERRNAFRVSDLLRQIPGLRVRSAGGRRVTVQGLARCPRITFFIDGMKYRLRGDESIDEVLPPTSLIAIEVYARGVYDARYGDCSVVMWTGVPPAD